MSPSEPPDGAEVETVFVPYAFVPKDVVVNALIDPLVIATALTVPPVIATAFAFCVDMVPKEPVAFVTADATNAVVAIWVVLVPLAAVGAKGVPDNVGLAAKTRAPEPVSSVTAAAKFALEGEPKNVATPDPRLVIPVPPFATGNVPVTPVVNGRPVQLVNVPDDGVPSAGVTNVGLVAKTRAPDPVSSDTAAAKFDDDGVAKNVATPEPNPLIPVDTGKPVQFVNVPEAGVPNIGVVNVGLVKLGELFNTTLPDPVEVVVPVPPEATGSAEARVRLVRCVVVATTSVPLLNTTIVLPAGIATPVPVEFLIVIVSAQPL